jgi:hypothetical protein
MGHKKCSRMATDCTWGAGSAQPTSQSCHHTSAPRNTNAKGNKVDEAMKMGRRQSAGLHPGARDCM